LIQVDRGRLLDGNTIQPGEDWFTRAERETETLTCKPEVFKEDLYGHQEVRNALLELFFYKCAYCEMIIEDCDVEHYRPKGRVRESEHHTGYYWLAYTWSNLYPACPKCNREYKERGTHGDSRLGDTMGKADSFPLLDESTRAYLGEVSGEERALLDPAQDDPASHLDYNIAGEVSPRDGSLMGHHSIQTYALHRRPLVRLRREHLRHLKRRLKSLSNRDDQVAALKESQHSDQRFAGFVRAIATSLDLEALLGP